MAYIYSNLSDFWTSDDEDDEEVDGTEEDSPSTANAVNVANDAGGVENYTRMAEEAVNRSRDSPFGPNHELSSYALENYDETPFEKRGDVGPNEPYYTGNLPFANVMDSGLNFNLNEVMNGLTNHVVDNFSIKSMIEKYDISNFMYNDSLLKYCETAVTINDDSACTEKLSLNENFHFSCFGSVEYVSQPKGNVRGGAEGAPTKEVLTKSAVENIIDARVEPELEGDITGEVKLRDIEDATMEHTMEATPPGAAPTQPKEPPAEEPPDEEPPAGDDKGNVKYIRKKWVIEDNHSDVTKFSQNDLLLSYDFELDDFQKRSIKHLNNFKHVFVAAHTSAGKTLIAEHAIAMSIKLNKKAIYTSPIKALSNQKYHEFKNLFKSVGIITGDIKMNVHANCIIMTTEILRNLLYINDNIINNIHCVIFDEVHYVNDNERGFIWEESIIMLPPHVQILLLSATVPNYLEFADWVGFTKKKEIISIATTKRPVPLLHYIYAYDSIFPIMDENNKIYSSAFKEIYMKVREKEKAGAAVHRVHGGAHSGGHTSGHHNGYHGGHPGGQAKQAPGAKRNSHVGKNKQQGGDQGAPPNNDQPMAYSEYCKQKRRQKLFANEVNLKTEIQKLQALIKKLEQDNKLPVVLFCFSRIKCETYAKSMPHLNFLDNKHKSKVHLFIKESIAKLCAQDRELNQIQILTKLLEKGIGIHHSGLLPILKEIVEILFSKGLIKILFATETFAMGINMPAKSVVFTSIYKHDQLQKRILTSSEYTQMSGRAGRRSSDKYGYVYIYCADKIPDQVQLTEMLMQKAVSLKSKFKVTYNMILKLLINKQINIEKMLFSSFLESCRAVQIPLFKKDLKRKKKLLQNIKQVQCIYADDVKFVSPIENYVQIDSKLKHIGLSLHRKLFTMKNSNSFAIGRVMLLNNIGTLHSSIYGVYLGCDKSSSKRSEKVDFAPNSIFFQNHSRTGEESSERFFFLFILPDFMTYEQFLQKMGGEEDAPGGVKLPEQVNRSSVTHLNRLTHEKVNIFVNYRNLFSKQRIPTAIQIMHHNSFDTDMQKKHFVVCSNVSLEHISIITNTVIVLPNVKTTAILNNPKNMLLYSLELDRLIEKGNFEPFVLTKMLKSLKCEFYSVLINQADYLEALKKSKCYSCNMKEKHYELVCKRNNCLNDIENIERNINAKSLNLYEDLEGRLDVLRHFSFIDDEHNLTVKGKIASYITMTDEITLTQVIFENVLNNLNPPEIAAVLSCFVAPEKKIEESPDLTVNLQEVKMALTNIHSQFEEFYKIIRLKISSEDHWKLCSFKIMFIAYKWALGVSFAELLEQSELEEGLIVRSILRLDDLCRKVKIAFLYLGNVDLAERLETTCTLLRRDIIFMTSLYLQ
ncbi:adenosinetriphosphatase [Plasmodium inui San Antonio 1]|uniref:Adenosinetriphosphatase n=1 Tax=Plasmodium inui San Antonio 1 TaxID=1237626 RepID=W7A9G6_9APIC|nr:adenosinetriphosphatase [Plasmodium inui San Antonio 1]EUD67923.1 adenosinetriphosphatase [Plasmodium inui San Antonio 1]